MGMMSLFYTYVTYYEYVLQVYDPCQFRNDLSVFPLALKERLIGMMSKYQRKNGLLQWSEYGPPKDVHI